MKIYYLSKNKFSGEYFLDDSPNLGKNRIYLSSKNESETFNELKKYLDFKKRKTLLNVVREGFSGKFIDRLSKLEHENKKFNLKFIKDPNE